VIEVEKVSHDFARAQDQAVRALSDITLSVRAGEMVGLLGPSGCGKSTLLNIIGGLLRPTSGSVVVDGEPMRGIRAHRIAFVFQENTLFPWSTVAENLTTALEFGGIPKRERPERVANALAAVEMEQFATFFPAQLSGGMKQRVALARALCLETDVLLMDEPFAALDEQTRMLLGEDLSLLLSKTKKTIVLVTHSLNEAVFLSDRVFVMTARPGRIKAVVPVEHGHPRTPAFATSSIFNEIRGRLYELLHDEIRRAADAASEIA
jgi:NitT/TauT family transport system ATP-binding protein